MLEIKKIKYPRTYHLPFSDGYTKDDKVLASDKNFFGKKVVITEKMDGENTSVYREGFHSRSLDSSKKDYHSWLSNYIYSFSYLMDEDTRICGEYLYAKHSIKYEGLESYFLGFSVWKKDWCLDWDSTINYLRSMGLSNVPVLYVGEYNSKMALKLAKDIEKKGGEGLVVRIYGSFKYDEFKDCVAKYVRKNHINTDGSWKKSEKILNNLKIKVDKHT